MEGEECAIADSFASNVLKVLLIGRGGRITELIVFLEKTWKGLGIL
jgi:hypothetical protein